MNKEICNSDVYLLVLGRPADPLCTLLSAFASQQRYMLSVYPSIYQVLGELETIPDNQTIVLVSRPAMLISQAAVFLRQHFSNLRLVGWLGPNENMSDAAVAQAVESGMVMVSCCDQLRHVIPSLCTTVHQKSPACDIRKPEIAGKIDPLEYKLCDDELNALLGVE